MFFINSEQKRARVQAEQLLILAEKVDNYRWDVLPTGELETLRAAMAKVRDLHKQKAPAKELNQASEELHLAMLPCGGSIYPMTFLGEHVEMVLMVAFLIIGVRAFFLQPFQIPTNSMYPSYNGMTSYVYTLDSPNLTYGERAWNFITQGADHYDVYAPADGEVVLPISRIYPEQPRLNAINTTIMERKWTRLWLKDVAEREYNIIVGNKQVALRVPQDFDNGVEQAFFETYFPTEFAAAWNDQPTFYGMLRDEGHIQTDEYGNSFVMTGHVVRTGDKVLNFDLRAGDMLFVDRFSYNFITPQPGDPFVFHTAGIAQLPHWLNGLTDDQYYVKRLVGLPGDLLEVHAPALFRNGAPITGAAAFDKNARRDGDYPGYTYGDVTQGCLLGQGRDYLVPDGYFFAMGDNSPWSLDGRYWGGVPVKNVVGRAAFVIYPFTSHWGLAH